MASAVIQESTARTIDRRNVEEWITDISGLTQDVEDQRIESTPMPGTSKTSFQPIPWSTSQLKKTHRLNQSRPIGGELRLLCTHRTLFYFTLSNSAHFKGVGKDDFDRSQKGSSTAQSLFDALRWKAKSRLVAPLGSQLMSLGSSMKRLCLRIP